MTNANLTKADLTTAVTDKIGYSQRDSQNIVDQIFELMKSSLEAGEQVYKYLFCLIIHSTQKSIKLSNLLSRTSTYSAQKVKFCKFNTIY